MKPFAHNAKYTEILSKKAGWKEFLMAVVLMINLQMKVLVVGDIQTTFKGLITEMLDRLYSCCASSIFICFSSNSIYIGKKFLIKNIAM